MGTLFLHPLMETGLPFYVVILAACSAKEVPSFLSHFKTLSNGPAPGIEPATSRSAVKRSTDWANPATVTNYCESCILTFTLPDFLLKHLQRLQFAAATFTRGRYVQDFSLLKLVHKVLYMNNWPLALRSNQVTSLCTLRSSSASRLSNPRRSSGTICPVKYPALTLFQILTAMLKHIFLTDKRLICRVFICRVFIYFCRIFISFIILFIVLFYFIFFLPFTCL